MVVTSTSGSKSINALVGSSSRVSSSRDKIELEEVERVLEDQLPLINLRKKGLSVMLVPFLPLNRYSLFLAFECADGLNIDIVVITHYSETMFACAYSNNLLELGPP